MKIRIPSAILIAVSFIACTSNSTDSKSRSSEPKDSLVATTAGGNGQRCFMKQEAGDTFRLKANIANAQVNGELSYHFREKDSNSGTIVGTMIGDTLIADYTFQSEGQTSIRQVAFLLSPEAATEGYGDLEEKDGKLVFKNRSGITFEKGLMLKKSICP